MWDLYYSGPGSVRDTPSEPESPKSERLPWQTFSGKTVQDRWSAINARTEDSKLRDPNFKITGIYTFGNDSTSIEFDSTVVVPETVCL